MSINVGTSGYSYKFWGPIKNSKGLKCDSYYPTTVSKNWLKKYSQDFKSLEINSTRYSTLKPSSCEKWASIVPEDFTFTIKAPLFITHQKKLNDFEDWWNKFKPCIDALGKKFLCLLFQFPPKFYCTKSNIEKLQNIKRILPYDIKCAFEFRDNEWYNEPLNELFKNNWTQVINVVPELRNEDANFGNLSGGIHIGVINPTFIYIRFHGTTGYSCGTYNKKLKEYIDIINEIKTDSSEFINKIKAENSVIYRQLDNVTFF